MRSELEGFGARYHLSTSGVMDVDVSWTDVRYAIECVGYPVRRLAVDVRAILLEGGDVSKAITMVKA